MNRRTPVLVLALGLAVATLATVPANAAGAGSNVFRFGAAYVSPSGDLTEHTSETTAAGGGLLFVTDLTLKAEAQDTLGFGASYEHLVTDRVGVEVSVLYSDLDIDVTADGTVQLVDAATGQVLVTDSASDSVSGNLSASLVTAGFNYHFGNGPVDWYAGVFAGWAFFGDVKFPDGAATIDDDFTWGAGVGLDVPFGSGTSGWLFNASLRYYKVSAKVKESDVRDEVGLDPIVLQAGVGYSF